MGTINFSRNADVYDRRHGAWLSPDLTAQIIAAAKLGTSDAILDLAAGTGRASIAWALAGLDVTATDVSADMLAQIKAKPGGQAVTTLVADSAHLPFPDDSFDAVSIARALYLIPGWREVLTEARRVLKPDGVFLHEWGNGDPDELWVQVREELRRRLDAAGYENVFHPGARTQVEIERYLSGLGLTRKHPVSAGPGTPMSLGEFITKIESREASYLWNVPQDEGQHIMDEVKLWAQGALGPLTTPISMPRNSHWRIYSRS